MRGDQCQESPQNKIGPTSITLRVRGRRHIGTRRVCTQGRWKERRRPPVRQAQADARDGRRTPFDGRRGISWHRYQITTKAAAQRSCGSNSTPATEADYWVHELRRADETLVYLMFPIDRLKALCREAIKAGRGRDNAGDGGRFSVVILPLKDILK
jgi:hypothetical protein